jgi:hypothetical protein
MAPSGSRSCRASTTSYVSSSKYLINDWWVCSLSHGHCSRSVGRAHGSAPANGRPATRDAGCRHTSGDRPRQPGRVPPMWCGRCVGSGVPSRCRITTGSPPSAPSTASLMSLSTQLA